MRFPISARLFLAAVLAMLAVAALGLALVRWRFAASPLPPPRADPAIPLVVEALSAEFAAHQGWGFLPARAGARAAWLRTVVGQATGSAAAADGGATLADRIALTDASGRRLAGIAPAAPLVALASIDRRRVAIPSAHGVAGYLTIAVPRDPEDALTIAFLLHQQRGLATLAVFALVLSALGALVVATRLRRPLRALLDGSRRLARGDFDARLDDRRRDELGELARAFNELGARLQAAARSRRQWIADTSHELRTPLAVLTARVEAMQDGVRPLSLDGLEAMATQLASLRALVDDLDQLARGDEGRLSLHREPVDLWSLARSAWNAFDDRFRRCGLASRLVPPEAAAIGPGDAARLGQVFRNLMENSARYTAAGGHVMLSGEIAGGCLHLRFDDSAPAVADPDLARLGERFFRADASRSRAHGGSGLGLALSRQIVEAHGGRLEFAPSPLGGLRATVRLPLEVA